MDTASYKDNSIFENEQINAICDILFEKLVIQFPPDISDVDNDYVYKGIILSGRGAAILQGATATDLKNIIFQTYQTEIYTYLKTALAEIFKCPVIVFNERILFYPFGHYFEIWWSSDPLEEKLHSGIYIQQTASIPNITL